MRPDASNRSAHRRFVCAPARSRASRRVRLRDSPREVSPPSVALPGPKPRPSAPSAEARSTRRTESAGQAVGTDALPWWPGHEDPELRRGLVCIDEAQLGASRYGTPEQCRHTARDRRFPRAEAPSCTASRSPSCSVTRAFWRALGGALPFDRNFKDPLCRAGFGAA